MLVGIVLRAHGLAGEVTVRRHNLDSAVWRSGQRLWLADQRSGGRWTTIVAVHGNRMKLEGVVDRRLAEQSRGSELSVDRGELPVLEAEEMYLHDLLGFGVEDSTGRWLGEFKGINVAGSREFFVVQGEHETLLPAEMPVFGNVDVARRVVRLVVEVDPPEDRNAAPGV